MGCAHCFVWKAADVRGAPTSWHLAGLSEIREFLLSEQRAGRYQPAFKL